MKNIQIFFPCVQTPDTNAIHSLDICYSTLIQNSEQKVSLDSIAVHILQIKSQLIRVKYKPK